MPEDIKPTSDPRTFKVYDPSLSTYGITPRIAAYDQSRYDTPFVIPEQDLGLTLQKMRAENQGALMELGTAAANLIPNTALTIVESAAHLADLEDWSNMIQGNKANYGNVLTEWAGRNKNVFGEVYRKDPQAGFDIMDSAWWISNGAGLVESVAAFGLTGYGVGSLLTKATSAVAKGLNAYGKAKMGLDLAAQIGTSGTLAFTEGAMTGAQVFKDVYSDAYNTKRQEILNQGAQQYGEENLTEEYYKYADTAAKQFANETAGESATTAVRINMANTFLNFPETKALFRSMSANRYLDDALKLQRGELAKDAIERIKSFDVAKHLTREGIKSKVKEIGGESLEEMVNVYAEQEGKNVGRKAMGKDITTLAEMLADDDIWAAGFWGAVGGSMQGFVMNKMPKWVTQEDGTTKRTTIGAYNKEQVETKYKEQIGDLTDRLTEFVTAKDNLIKASQTNDEKLYNESINTIFKYNSFNSIVKGVEEQLIGEYQNIMSLSSEEAAQQGFKGDYKQDAAKKIQSVREYTNEWNKIQDRYMSQDLDMAGYPETIFQQFVNVENNKNIITEQEFEINKLQSDINQSYALKGTDLTIAAYNDIVSSIRALDNDFELETIDLENLMNLDKFDSQTRKRIIAKLNNKYGNLENAKTQVEKNLQNIREKARDFEKTFELQRENFDIQVDPENKLSQEEKDQMFARILAENEFEINALTEAKSQLQRNRETLRAQEDELRQLKSKEGVQKFKDLKKQKLAEQNQNAETEVVQEQQAQAEAEREQRQEVINDIRTRQEEAPETITPEEAITLEELERVEQEELGVQGETYQEGGYTGEGSKPEELRQQYEDISKSANNTNEKGKVVDQNNNPIFVDDKLIFSFDKIAYASTIEYSEDEVSGKIKHTSLQLNPETNPDFLTTKFMPGTPIKLKKLDSNEFKPFIASRKISFKDELDREVVVANAGETVTFEMLSHPYMQPIGIYDIDGKVIGMLHDVTYIRPSRVLQESLEDDRNNLIALRSKIGDTFIETTITGKTNGHINQLRDGFRKLNELIQNPIEFAIATSSIQLNTSKTVIVDGLINKPNYKVGQVYAITYTPNGQKIAIPVKTTQVKEHTNVMNELLATFDKFAEDKISQNDLKETFSKYIYSTPTSEKLDAKGKSFKREPDGKDRFYIDFDSLNVDGIVFGKSGDNKKFLSVNTPKDQIEGLRKAFIDILSNSYININFEKLRDTNFVKEFATSNVRFYSLPDGRVTVFDNPVISIGTSFAGEIKPIEKTQEQPRVASEIISDEVYNNFIDNNIVPDDILNDIANKIINKVDLSTRETSIFSGKTSEINEIIRQQVPSQPEVTTTSDIVTVYHHTSVKPEDFDFNNFQRGANQISQFGDGLNVASTTTPFFVQRYGNPIQGEVKDSDFVVIDANKSEKQLYEELKAKGYKFNNPATGSYIGNDPTKQYDDTVKANEQPAIISLFNDFQKSNPEVKGVKVINHIIGNEKVDPFYVIYDSKSFYGSGSLSQAPASAPVSNLKADINKRRQEELEATITDETDLLILEKVKEKNDSERLSREIRRLANKTKKGRDLLEKYKAEDDVDNLSKPLNERVSAGLFLDGKSAMHSESNFSDVLKNITKLVSDIENGRTHLLEKEKPLYAEIIKQLRKSNDLKDIALANKLEAIQSVTSPLKGDSFGIYNGEKITGKSEQEVKDKINAKYDAELAASEGKTTQQGQQTPVSNIEEYKPKNTIGYLPIPNKDGSFSVKSFSNTPNESNSMFQVEDLGNDRIGVSFWNNNRAVKDATSSPELILNPIVKLQDALNQNTNKITTTKPAIFKKQGDKYVLEQKAEMYYSKPTQPPATTSTLGFENLGNIGNQGFAIMEDDILKKGKHVISNISKATPEQRQKIDSNIVTLQFKYPEKNITTKSWGDSLIIEVTPTIEVKPFTSNNGIEFTPELDEDDLLPTVTEVKPGVEELFNSNPELASIGTQEQYSQYLDTIFPDSKVKDIVYHGAMEQLLPKDGKFKGYVTYFTDFKNYAETFGFPINRKIISAVINVKSPFNAQSELADVPEEIHVTDQFTNPRIIKSNTKGYDSVVGTDAGQKEGKTIAVFEPEQIHILGGKQDVEGFKKFVDSGKQIEKSLSLQSKILNLINEGKITKFCK